MKTLKIEELKGAEIFGGNAEITRLRQIIQNSRKIVVISGAGISVSAGIPDFRSADGLYARVLATENKRGNNVTVAKGKDFFDSSFFYNPKTRPFFHIFIAELYSMSKKVLPTKTHLFIKKLHDSGRLLRWYTQNIDGLEKVTGLSTSSCETVDLQQKPPVVNLHGTLNRMICTVCKSHVSTTEDHYKILAVGESPNCKNCEELALRRHALGKRKVASGVLRPDIVLYNEIHPHGDLIAEIELQDIKQNPNVLIVIGTSLKVIGLKKLIRDFAKKIQNQHGGGYVLFINKTNTSLSEWCNIFDYQLIGECDHWIDILSRGMVCSELKMTHTNTTNIKKNGRIDKMLKFVRNNIAPKKFKSIDEKLIINDEKTEMDIEKTCSSLKRAKSSITII